MTCRSQRLLQSFKHWTGDFLFDASGSSEEIAQALFEAVDKEEVEH